MYKSSFHQGRINPMRGMGPVLVGGEGGGQAGPFHVLRKFSKLLELAQALDPAKKLNFVARK